MNGLRLMVAHARLMMVLSFFPFTIMLATLVVLRLLRENLTVFWFPVLQLPASFVIGLQCALILRFFLLGEYPLLPEGEEKSLRNRAVMHAALAYASIKYFMMGLYGGLEKMRLFLTASPEAAAPYMPLVLAIMILFLWAARWFWLHLPIALDWPVSAFYARVGRWAGSLRIFGLFAVCALMMNFVAGFIRLVIAGFSTQPLSGFAAAFDDAAVAAVTLLLAILFTASSAAAVRRMADVKIPNKLP